MTTDGMEAFGAQWKTIEAKIVEGPALPNDAGLHVVLRYLTPCR
jgi:hypothetical protein